MKILGIVLMMMGLSACTPAGLLNATVPRQGYTKHADIAYGPDARRMLDVYVPNDGAPMHDVVVFFYGGSWQEGSRSDYRFVGEALASRGIVAVIPDYRLAPEVGYPAFLEDGAQAVAWAHAHAGTYAGNASRLFLAGHSAGAYNAAMLTLNETFLKTAGGSREWVKGTIGLAGPYDFLPLTDPKLIVIFGGAQEPASQPITYAGPGMPPMLLVTGSQDTSVYPRNTEHLTAQLRGFGNRVETRVYPGIGHIGLVLSLARGFRWSAPTLRDIEGFVKSVK